MWHHRCEAACTFVKVCIPSGLRIDVTGLLTAPLSRHGHSGAGGSAACGLSRVADGVLACETALLHRPPFR